MNRKRMNYENWIEYIIIADKKRRFAAMFLYPVALVQILHLQFTIYYEYYISETYSYDGIKLLEWKNSLE